MTMTMPHENTPFKTRDLYEAAYLFAKGTRLLSVEGSSFQFFFIFEDSHSCESLLESYYTRRAQIDALTLSEAHMSLKQQLRRLQR